MNREQLLEALKEVRQQLPTVLANQEYSKELADKSAEETILAEDQLRKMTSAEGALAEEPKAIVDAKSEVENADEELTAATLEYATSEATLRQYEADATENEYKAKIAKKKLSSMATDEDKAKLQEQIDEFEDNAERNKKYAEEEKKALEFYQEKIDTCKKTLDASNTKLEEERTKEDARVEAEYNKRVEAEKKNVDILRTKSGALTLDIAKNLDSLIADYEAGRASEAEVNYTIGWMRNALGANAFIETMNEEEASIIIDQMSSYDERINELEARLANEENYIIPEEEYQRRLSELKAQRTREKKNMSSQTRRMNANQARIDEIYAILADPDSGLSPEEFTNYTDEIAKIRNRNDGIRERKNNREELIFDLNSQIEELESTHGKALPKNMSADKKELKDLKNRRETLTFEQELYKSSLDNKMARILLGTGSKVEDIEDKKDKTAVVAPIIDEKDKDLGEDPSLLFPPLLTDEDKDLGEDPEIAFPVLPKEDEEDDDKKIIPIVGKHAAKKTLKDKLKELWPKIKKYIAVVLAALAIGAIGHTVVKNIDASKVDDPAPIEDVIDDNDLDVDDIIDEGKDDTPTPETPTPETPTPETPSPETPSPETPSPETPTPETPSPETPTPETPTPETPEESEVHPADPDKVYLADGDYVQDDSTNVSVDSEGNQYVDGEKVGVADVEKTPGGYTVVDVPGDFPEVKEEEATVTETPTGHETDDTSDLTEGEKANLDAAVEADLDNFENFNWDGFVDSNGMSL